MPLSVRARAVAALVAAGALVLVGVLSGCSGGSNAVDQTANGQFRYVGATSKGTTIPAQDRKAVGEVSAPYLMKDGTWRLAESKGDVVVLNYWAQWCGPCKTESPSFDKIYRATKDQGVSFVGIDVKDPSKSAAQAFITDNDISYPIVYDQTAKTALQLGKVPTQGLPSTVLIDKQGRVAAVYVGIVQAGDLQPVLDKLIAER